MSPVAMFALLPLLQPIAQWLGVLLALAVALVMAYGLHHAGVSWWGTALGSAVASLLAHSGLRWGMKQVLQRIPLLAMLGSFLAPATRPGVVATTKAKPALSQAHALAKLKAELAVATDTNRQLQAKIASLEAALQKALSR